MNGYQKVCKKRAVVAVVDAAVQSVRVSLPSFVSCAVSFLVCVNRLNGPAFVQGYRQKAVLK